MKIGVYLCSCGALINDALDLDLLSTRIQESYPDTLVKRIEYLCAEDGLAEFRAELLSTHPDRVVVAACSPREHEGTIMAALEAAGINPWLMQMANIREQVAWVTPYQEDALDKAFAVIRAAIQRVVLHEPLVRQEIEIAPDVLVIGGGPAGLSAARVLAEAGRRVLLVEQSAALGGMAVLQDKILPGGECGSCLMDPLIDELLHGNAAHNIELLTLTTVDNVKGEFGRFLITIRSNPRHIDPACCIGCMVCSAVCPIQQEDGTAAIAPAFPGALPNLPLLDESICLHFQGTACDACCQACPAGLQTIRLDESETIQEREVGSVIIAAGATYDVQKGGTIPQPLPGPALQKLAQLFDLPLEQNGWLRAAHPITDSTASMLRGVWMAGAANQAIDLKQVILQGVAAGGQVLSQAPIGTKICLETAVAEVDQTRCSGCRVCRRICPYQAITVDTDGLCQISSLLCRGCGGCTAACPAGAIQAKGFTREQLLAEVQGLLA
jgi:heterodisulfide reductase subunit A-like polyferredoxin